MSQKRTNRVMGVVVLALMLGIALTAAWALEGPYGIVLVFVLGGAALFGTWLRQRRQAQKNATESNRDGS